MCDFDEDRDYTLFADDFNVWEEEQVFQDGVRDLEDERDYETESAAEGLESEEYEIEYDR